MFQQAARREAMQRALDKPTKDGESRRRICWIECLKRGVFIVGRVVLMLLALGVVREPCVLRAQANMQEAKAIAEYPLTMDHVTRHFQVAADVARDPQLKTEFAELSDRSLEDRVKKAESLPKLMSLARARGIAARDFIMTSAALGPAIAVAGLIDTGERGPGESEQDKIFWAAAPPDHIQFYRDHKAEIDKMVADLMRIGKQGAESPQSASPQSGREF